QHFQQSLNHKQNPPHHIIPKQNKTHKHLNKIPHLHKQIHHHKKQFLQPTQLPQTHHQILNLSSRLYFPNPYELNYFSPPSSQKYNQYIG
ncbi:peptidoglycan bridge formation glycyltransferase FemA/FemB family protein, partial [Staphylococcus epidermidis]|uniref:peptidoglycan bridge formation glycyltransferase FemA/FemB family protein n=1 Tax=Staphylococcus epidermidis TaxID=1282 RepID=UPI0011A85FA6